MIKTCFLIVTVLVLGVISNSSKQTEPISSSKITVEHADIAGYDFGFVENGKLKFYNAKKGMAYVCTQETDSVVDAICSEKGKVYYNVIAGNRLILKCLDMNSANLVPERLADWNLDLNADDYAPAYGKMYFSMDQTQIALEVDVSWFGGPCSNLAVYDCKSKKIKKIILYQYDDDLGYVVFKESSFKAYKPKTNFDEAHFEDSAGFYYIGGGKRVRLNDQLNDSKITNLNFGDIEFEHYPVELDPSGKKVLFATSTFLGDGVVGFYAVSSLDGKSQVVLPDSNVMDDCPKWLNNGSLVYVGNAGATTLFLMDANGDTHPIAQTNKFFVLP